MAGWVRETDRTVSLQSVAGGIGLRPSGDCGWSRGGDSARVTAHPGLISPLLEQTSGDCDAHQNKDGGTNLLAPTARASAYPVAELEADHRQGNADPGDEESGQQ